MGRAKSASPRTVRPIRCHERTAAATDGIIGARLSERGSLSRLREWRRAVMASEMPCSSGRVTFHDLSLSSIQPSGKQSAMVWSPVSQPSWWFVFPLLLSLSARHTWKCVRKRSEDVGQPRRPFSTNEWSCVLHRYVNSSSAGKPSTRRLDAQRLRRKTRHRI